MQRIYKKMNNEENLGSNKRGHWTKDEQNLFNFAYQWHGKDWKKLAEIITTRNIVQIRSHAQKVCMKNKGRVGECEVPKVYVLDTTFCKLNEYIANACSNSYKKYMEMQQLLMYSQAPETIGESKLCDTPMKIELNHS